MKLGIYGGTFNPVHYGHLAVARAVRDGLGLDRLVLVPSGRPPHKASGLASGADRLRMVELATRDEPGLEASDIEVAREGVSYTVDTLEAFRRREPESELFFVVGADSVSELRTWRDLPGIFARARIVIVNRPGFEPPIRPEDYPGVHADLVSRLEPDRVEMPPSAVSSTEVRAAIREGRSLESLVPDAIASYVRDRGLYRE